MITPFLLQQHSENVNTEQYYHSIRSYIQAVSVRQKSQHVSSFQPQQNFIYVSDSKNANAHSSHIKTIEE